MKTWDAMSGDEKGEAIERLVPILSYREIAAKLGAPSRAAVAGVLWRHRHPAEAAVHLRELQDRKRARTRARRTWSEEVLTETWAERKARRARERSLNAVQP